MENKKPRTTFFFLGIVALFMALCICVYHVSSYKAQYDYYIQQGYDEQTVKEGFPISQLIPDFFDAFASWGFFACVMFGFDALLQTKQPNSLQSAPQPVYTDAHSSSDAPASPETQSAHEEHPLKTQPENDALKKEPTPPPKPEKKPRKSAPKPKKTPQETNEETPAADDAGKQ